MDLKTIAPGSRAAVTERKEFYGVTTTGNMGSRQIRTREE